MSAVLAPFSSQDRKSLRQEGLRLGQAWWLSTKAQLVMSQLPYPPPVAQDLAHAMGPHEGQSEQKWKLLLEGEPGLASAGFLPCSALPGTPGSQTSPSPLLPQAGSSAWRPCFVTEPFLVLVASPNS